LGRTEEIKDKHNVAFRETFVLPYDPKVMPRKNVKFIVYDAGSKTLLFLCFHILFGPVGLLDLLFCNQTWGMSGGATEWASQRQICTTWF
jgi:hypothetical protein